MSLKELNASEPLKKRRNAVITSKPIDLALIGIIIADELLTGYEVYGAEMAGTLSRLISGTGETNIR